MKKKTTKKPTQEDGIQAAIKRAAKKAATLHRAFDTGWQASFTALAKAADYLNPEDAAELIKDALENRMEDTYSDAEWEVRLGLFIREEQLRWLKEALDEDTVELLAELDVKPVPAPEPFPTTLRALLSDSDSWHDQQPLPPAAAPARPPSPETPC